MGSVGWGARNLWSEQPLAPPAEDVKLDWKYRYASLCDPSWVSRIEKKRWAANSAIPVDAAVTQLTNGNCASLELSLNLLLEFGFLSADSNSVQLMLSSS